MKPNVIKYLLLVSGLCVLLTACAGGALRPVSSFPASLVEDDGPGDPALIDDEALVVEDLPKSTRGNMPSYTVFGRTYQVMDTARDFREWGTATWYGSKFHGRETSSGEIYDMYRMTAAHRHLPLPTFVRVTRLDNDRSVVVKVNDRGPFVDDRVIDLSYAAAARLGMIREGTAEVFIEALSSHENASPELYAEIGDEVGPPLEDLTFASSVRAGGSGPITNVSTAEFAQSSVGRERSVSGSRVYSQDQPLPMPLPMVEELAGSREAALNFVQVGAFSDRDNAERMMAQLKTSTRLPLVVAYDSSRALYRVRVGPLSNEQQVDRAINDLQVRGIQGFPIRDAMLQ